MRRILLGLVATAAIASPIALTATPAEAATSAQRNATASAQSYLSWGAFSRAGLIDQLSSKYGEGYRKADAVYAVNHVRVNWRKEAVQSAKSYLSWGSFSRAGLIDQLESPYGEQFTHRQAVYGVNRAY